MRPDQASPQTDERAPQDDAPRGGVAGAVALFVILVLLAGAIALVRGSTSSAPSSVVMGTDKGAAPVVLESLQPAVAAQYRHAAGHQDIYLGVPCYCGCDVFADHHNLYDCFIRTDGAGYDAHAAGCAICQAEAREVQRLTDADRSPSQIRARVVEQFGPATNPAGTSDA